MTWERLTDLFDTANAKNGVIVTIPTVSANVTIWQDTTNPVTAPLDMDALTLSVADLDIGFHMNTNLKIFAEVITG
jgi:hypothetical protein